MNNRVLNKDLIALSVKGSLCEVCGRYMHSHEWADLDANGFVVACSFQEVEKK